MKLLFSEQKSDYEHYQFPYAIWAVPETGETPADGTYTKKGGSPLIVRGGRIVSPVPKPTRTPRKGLGDAGNVPK